MAQGESPQGRRADTIDAALVLAALEGALAKGIEVEPLLAEVGSSRRQLLMGEGISPARFSSLLRSLWTLLDDESSGFASRPLRGGCFRMMCHATIGCFNLRRALIRVGDFFRLLSDEYQWSLEEQGEQASLVLGGEQGSDRAFLLLSLCVILHRWSAWMIDTPLTLTRVDLPFAEERFDLPLAPLLQTQIEFEAAVTRLVFPRVMLQKPIKQSSETLGPFLADSPERLLTLYRPDDSQAFQVRRYLEGHPQLESLSQEQVAAQFNISVATLGRRLKREGHQFHKLKDRVRRAQAIKLLLGSDQAISDIALALGYSEPSVFYRRFRRWAGMTPAEFRERHG
ncbi:AraC family transcriptional regulator [Ferrimonas sediminicola]|uniref:AraC family transcriptional regulator n=1 Tax=Ferrimonas sediminicola TaxID=2569538 RepID=A0A4V5NXJ7_9GAMM|nr:AraC family transcriptional regulator [Ferrimonas sediminicola]TKB48844.1 AraC family transcriptional regulator [Ferrimonas sediminicola]